MADATKDTKKAPVQQARPLVRTGVQTEFGEAMIDPERERAGTDVGTDPTYVPGFSDLRFTRDQQLAESARGRHPIGKVLTLPINLRWSRRTNTTGTPDGRKVQKAKQQGYQPVTASDIGQPWLTEMPEGATLLPSGEIVKGDTVLMKCAAERAALNQYRKQELTMNRLGASLQKAEDLGMAAETTQGAAQTLGSTVDMTT